MATATRAAHTPGPWLVESVPAEAHTDPDILIPEESQFWIVDTRPACEVIALIDKVALGDAGANARLMAAAPDLLTTLRSFVSAAEAYMRYHAEKFYGDSGMAPTGLWPQIEAARAVIAKAEGV